MDEVEVDSSTVTALTLSQRSRSDGSQMEEVEVVYDRVASF